MILFLPYTEFHLEFRLLVAGPRFVLVGNFLLPYFAIMLVLDFVLPVALLSNLFDISFSDSFRFLKFRLTSLKKEEKKKASYHRCSFMFVNCHEQGQHSKLNPNLNVSLVVSCRVKKKTGREMGTET